MRKKPDKKLCSKCGVEYSMFVHSRHERTCENTRPLKKAIAPKPFLEEGKLLCAVCREEVCLLGYASHWRHVHRGDSPKGKGWNKGLTKETNSIVSLHAENLRQRFLSGDLSRLGRKHSPETILKLKRVAGGLRRGAGRGKNGWYRGYWCDSSWELAWIIFQLDHGVSFKRNTEGFEYLFEGKRCKFFPDFLLDDGTFVEIKGWMDSKNQAKIDSFERNLLLIGPLEIQPFIEYASSRFGVNFISQYEPLW